MREKTLNIQGMSCRSCAKKIEKNVQSLKGIESVQVQISNNKSYIKFDENVLDLKIIQKIIENLGYQVDEEKIEKNNNACSCCQS